MLFHFTLASHQPHLSLPTLVAHSAILQCRNLRTSIAASSSKFDCWFGNLAASFAADLTAHFQYSVSLRGAPFNSLFFYILRSITSFQPPFFISHPAHRLKYRLSLQCAWISRAILTYPSPGWNNKNIAANNPADLFQAVTHFNSTIYHSNIELLSNPARSGFTSYERRILVVSIQFFLTPEAGPASFLSRLQLPAPRSLQATFS